METELEQARRIVRLGEEHIASQRKVLAKLRADGHSTKLAEQLLATLEETQKQQQVHLDRLLRDA